MGVGAGVPVLWLVCSAWNEQLQGVCVHTCTEGTGGPNRREQIYLEGVELFPEPTSGAQSLPSSQEGAGEGTLFLAVGWG